MTDKPFEGVSHVELDFEELLKMLKMSPDDMLEFLHEIHAKQNNLLKASDIRIMLGEDNLCDCPKCKDAKIKSSVAEDKLKEKQAEPEGIMSTLFNMFASEEMKSRKKHWDDMIDQMTLAELRDKEKPRSEEEPKSEPESDSEPELEQMPKWASHRAIDGLMEWIKDHYGPINPQY